MGEGERSHVQLFIRYGGTTNMSQEVPDWETEDGDEAGGGRGGIKEEEEGEGKSAPGGEQGTEGRPEGGGASGGGAESKIEQDRAESETKK